MRRLVQKFLNLPQGLELHSSAALSHQVL